MPTYEHKCEACQHEWEEFYKITEDPPTVCPSCGEEGQVQRLISGGSGRGIVVLTGHERAAHLKSEGQKMFKEMQKNENLRANFVGEETYHQNQLSNAKLENELVQIGKEAPKTTSASPPKKGFVKRVDKK